MSDINHSTPNSFVISCGLTFIGTVSLFLALDYWLGFPNSKKSVIREIPYLYINYKSRPCILHYAFCKSRFRVEAAALTVIHGSITTVRGISRGTLLFCSHVWKHFNFGNRGILLLEIHQPPSYLDDCVIFSANPYRRHDNVMFPIKHDVM